MNEKLMAVLLYILEHHLQKPRDQKISEATLMGDLSEAGFDKEIIFEAFEWLKHIFELNVAESDHDDISSSAIRVFSDEECQALSTEVRGYILFLEHAGILNANTRERVTSRLLANHDDSVELHHVKAITMLVLQHASENDPSALHCIESLLVSEHEHGWH